MKAKIIFTTLNEFGEEKYLLSKEFSDESAAERYLMEHEQEIWDGSEIYRVFLEE